MAGWSILGASVGVPHIRPAPPADGNPRPPSDDVELYHRTYTTLLRSSGETWLRVLEPVHRAMGSSLHGLAASDDVDLGALIYACRRLPADVYTARRVVLGQEAVQFSRAGMRTSSGRRVEAPARRRRWFADGTGTLAVLLASGSDLDDVVPTLVAYQLEWNKLHRLLIASAARRRRRRRGDLASTLGGTEEDWERLLDALGATLVDEVRDASLDLRIRMLGGSAVGYARITRRWWTPVQRMLDRAGRGGPPAVPRLLEHPLPGEPPERTPAHARGRGRPLDRPRGTAGPARRARALPRGADARLVGELPLLRRPGRAGATQCRGARDGRDASLERDRAPGERPGHAARAPATRALRLPAERRRPAALARAAGRHRQHRVSARPRRVQHPARDHDRVRHPPRRLRAGQGSDAERRGRRRDAVQRHLRRALAARRTGSTTPSRSRTSRRTSCSGRGSTTSGRSR